MKKTPPVPPGRDDWKKPSELRPGEIVQLDGEGRGMVVGDPANYPDRWWGDVPNAVVCEWTEEGRKQEIVCLAQDLEVVGSQRRRSDAEIYDSLTQCTIATITTLANEGKADMALGAFRLWTDIAGPAASDDDALRLRQLVDRAEAAAQ